MSNRSKFWFSTMLVLSSTLCLPHLAQGQQSAGQPAVRNMAEMKFEPVPGMPTCAPGAVQTGDPAKGPSILMGKMAAGCSIPWHWHTPNEHLMIVSGTARVEPKDGKPFTLRAGGFALMPSRHVHQFHCTTACSLFVYSDAAYDIHYVDAQGKEISLDDALKTAKKPASKHQTRR
jgi:quercetin dioxygenase-like cupin family protein